jgi:hypothetical protein
MNYKETFFNLLNTYLLFGLMYSGIIWLIWNFLFASLTGISLSFLQVFGLYVITRILVGNSSTQYVSNFYSPKPMSIDDINKKFDELKEKYSEDFEFEDNRDDKRD